MAKDKKTAKFQFVFLNVEGDDETIQEAIRQSGVVLNRGMNSASRTLVAVSGQKALLDGSSNSGGSPQQVYEIADGEALIDIEPSSNVSVPTPSKTKKPKKAPPIPAVLKDLDPNSASVPLAEFVQQKDTSTDYNKYLVIAAWFKKYQEMEQISTSHIYTCYQLLKWKAPNDMGQPFRGMKRSHNYFENGTGKNFWKITIIGLNEVDNMKSKSDKGD